MLTSPEGPNPGGTLRACLTHPNSIDICASAELFDNFLQNTTGGRSGDGPIASRLSNLQVRVLTKEVGEPWLNAPDGNQYHNLTSQQRAISIRLQKRLRLGGLLTLPLVPAFLLCIVNSTPGARS